MNKLIKNINIKISHNWILYGVTAMLFYADNHPYKYNHVILPKINNKYILELFTYDDLT